MLMNTNYDPQAVEAQAQKFWEENQSFAANEESQKEKFYCLSMFPYPSGALHMGHVRNYTIGDCIARYQRMLGKNVLHPMGWDAFGLPAENAAIQNDSAPSEWTKQNIDKMRDEFKSLGLGFDWNRELATCDPEYYRWEQWFFTQLYEKGLVYRKKSMVNWDPVDQTVLANEQVVEGRGWRSNALVEQKEIDQWFLKITAYSEELLKDLDSLPGWPHQVKLMQKNWIGRSEGVEVVFTIPDLSETLTVFTTRADTLMGVSYLAVSAQHPLAKASSEHNDAMRQFLLECQSGGTSEAELATLDKKGMDTGFKAIHPLTGQAIPIWVANFVLMSYGTGAIMAVPAHDQRDFEFAKKYNLPIHCVIQSESTEDEALPFVKKGVLVDSLSFTGLSSDEAIEAISAHLMKNGQGQKLVNYRLRDWGVSRQRYWGCPIPIIHCEQCGPVAVPEEDLPVRLPEQVKFDKSGRSPLASMAEFYEAPCPRCQSPAKRETDTFDTFFESSWYFARYACNQQKDAMLDEKANYWLPVDQYIGGIEHAILHLLYARFFTKLLRDQGLLEVDEPFKNLLTQGMVLADGFYGLNDQGVEVWYARDDVEPRHDAQGKIIFARLKATGETLQYAGMSKMSKSKNNGVNPGKMIEKYGADTLRLFTMFAAPPEQTMEWSESGVEGAQRFLKRLWKLVAQHIESHDQLLTLDVKKMNDEEKSARRKLHQTIKKINYDIGQRNIFNTVVAANMELINMAAKLDKNTPYSRTLCQEILESVILMLSPIVPHICHSLWQTLRNEDSIVMDQEWPKVDEDALKQETIEMIVQVNGKIRGRVQVSADASEAVVQEVALKNENVRQFLAEMTVQKIIVVPGRLINIVVK